MNTKIKICGLFRDEDIKSANIAKPDYIGFIFYPKSHRYVTPEQARLLKEQLSPNIKAAGVFVNSSVNEAAKIAKYVKLDIVQLHGDECNEEIAELKSISPQLDEVWKAIRIKENFDPDILNKYKNADKLVLDTYVDGYGGQGKSFDLNLIKGADPKRIILAGGLNPENIKDAINKVHPFGVDLSSSVETNKQKDRDKIINIVKLVRS